MVEKIKKQWFLIGLVLVCGAVILDPTSVLEMVARTVRNMNGPSHMIFLIFIISGLMLDSDQIYSGIRDTRATISALVVILIFSPVVALCFSMLAIEPSILIGLFIVSVMPTTLSSGVVMTRTAGGNMAHALFVTVVSNGIAIFSIPIVLDLLLSVVDLNALLVIDKSAIVFKLCFLVLLPLIMGLVLKSVVSKQINIEKLKLQTINQLLILSIVFVSVSTAKYALQGNAAKVVGIITVVAAFHLALLGAAAGLVKLAGISKGRFESVIFMGSQKTLPLSVMIQITYFSDFSLALVVCVCHHIVHLLIDGYISSQLSSNDTLE